MKYEGVKILIVDDNPNNLEVLFEHLRKYGFTVLIAQDGESALQSVKENRPDLILLDIMLPGIGGIETCRRLKQNQLTQNIPIIFVSVLYEPDDKVRGFTAGAVDYIAKPFHIEEVLARIETHLHIQNLQKSLEGKNRRLQQEIVKRRRVERERDFFFEYSIDMFCIINFNHKFIQVNPAWQKNLGWSREEMTGKSHLEFVHPNDIETTLAVANGYKNSDNQIVSIENRYRCKDGSYRWLAWNTIPLSKQQLSYSITRDVTERKQAEEELQRLYQQARHDADIKAKLLREVNHRVGNNLMAISGMLSIERGHLKEADHAAYESIMTDLNNRVMGLATVHNMLSASEWSPLPLDKLTHQVIHTALQILPPHKHITVKIVSTPVKVTSDQAHNLALIINELTTNTIKHALPNRDSARIMVNITLNGPTVQLKYKNDGPGYPKEILQHKQFNVGLDLVQQIAQRNLHGEWLLYNNSGAVTVIKFTSAPQGANL